MKNVILLVTIGFIFIVVGCETTPYNDRYRETTVSMLNTDITILLPAREISCVNHNNTPIHLTVSQGQEEDLWLTLISWDFRDSCNFANAPIDHGDQLKISVEVDAADTTAEIIIDI